MGFTEDDLLSTFSEWNRSIVAAPDVDLRQSADVFVAVLLGEKAAVFDAATSQIRLSETGDVLSVHRTLFSMFQRSVSALSAADRSRIASAKCALLRQSPVRKVGGDYFTPMVWVRIAHQTLDRHLGGEWHKTHTVWDASCGTGNLTRTRQIRQLLLSTKHEQDIRIMELLGYCRSSNARCAPFDFLSSMGVPDGFAPVLSCATRVLFLNNPPYKTANEQSFIARVERQSGVSSTNVKQMMKKAKLTRDGNQLTVQFMFKLSEISRSAICQRARSNGGVFLAIFTPTNILIGPGYESFMRFWSTHWEYLGGFIFPSQSFSDVKGAFSVTFSIWRAYPSVQPSSSATTSYPVQVFQQVAGGNVTNDGDGRILLRAVPRHERLNYWARSDRAGTDLIPSVPLTSALSVQTPSCRYRALAQLPRDALGYCHSNGNSVQHNGQLVGLYSSTFAAGHGFVVCGDNFLRACAVFAARRLITRSWLNWQSEYSRPIQDHPGLVSWMRDAVVFALFDTKSNQSSLRSPVVVANAWFWTDAPRIRQLAEDVKFQSMIDDLDASTARSEPFVARWLRDNRSDLGAEAIDLLGFADHVLETTMALRRSVHLSGAQLELSLASWDAGWYQIRKALQSVPSGTAHLLATWKTRRAALAARLQPGVYEFGFLADLNNKSR